MGDFRFIDLFCGGGGSITGEIAALKKAGIAYDGRGFNHWELAIRTIQANHPEIVPDFERACADICEVAGRPQSVYDDDPMRLDLLWASPSCTHHSNAAGGIPRSEQLRSQPWTVLPFLTLTKCRRMFVENVEELLSWGPILDKETIYKGKKYRAGQADPRLAGKLFHDWISAIRHSGYDVDWQILNAADYGAATSRKRLIVQAVRKSAGEKIVWPEPTHAREPGLYGYKPWRSAAEIIDWSIPGESIFDRKKPLCANTLRRIEAGIKKYWGAWVEPFLIVLRGTVKPCAGNPAPTIATKDRFSLIMPFLVAYYGNGFTSPADAPLPTICTKDRFGLVQGRILTLPDGQRYKLDITHRMLTARELAAATGFPTGYIFAGGDTAAKKMIGNAVCPDLAEALIRATLAA